MTSDPLIDSILVQTVLILAAVLACFWLIVSVIRFFHQQLPKQRSIVDQINRLLPQTQCGSCGYEGCRPYARAIEKGEAINKCPPGGTQTIINLANLLSELPQRLDPAHGKTQDNTVAVIREDECIGCTKCIKACPVDAILGGPKLMHSVIESECTGCDLCLEPCPVDCIDLIQIDPVTTFAWQLPTQISSPQNPDAIGL